MDVANNLWTATLRREQLFELLDDRGPRPTRAYSAPSLHYRDKSELVGIWIAKEEAELAPLPQMLVADRPILDDLFAWSATYLRALGPLSSIIRILTPIQFDALLNRTVPQQPWKLAGGAIGLVVGEILTHNEKVGVEGAVAATPNSTLAFAIIRAWYLGLPNSAIVEICDGYMHLFEQMQRMPSAFALQSVRVIAASLIGIKIDGRNGNSRLGQFVHWMEDLRSGANIYDVAADVLRNSVDLKINQDVLHLQGMTAEARVQFFDKLAPALAEQRTGGDSLNQAFALALTAFICRPGLEQQLGLLREHDGRLPESRLWLGALQAFSPISDALSLGSGGGWRIARELFRPEEPWSAPRADAGIAEINVLSRSKSKALERLIARPRLEIEIYPMITTAVRGINPAVERPSNGGRLHTEETPHLDAVAAQKVELIVQRLEETLRLARELRGNEAGQGGRPSRRRR